MLVMESNIAHAHIGRVYEIIAAKKVLEISNLIFVFTETQFAVKYRHNMFAASSISIIYDSDAI